MIPVDTDDITKAYQILLHELKMYNPELMDKPRMVAITKADLVDEEMESLLKSDIHVDVPYIFISSATGHGLIQLKDMLWQMMQN